MVVCIAAAAFLGKVEKSYKRTGFID